MVPANRLAVPRAARLASFALLVVLAGCAGAQRTGDTRYQLRLAMGEQLASQGDWAGAYRVADALCREEPKEGRAGLLRARALRHTGAVDEAEAALRDLLREEPKNAAAHAELAILFERTRRTDEALAHHQEALRLERGSPRYLNNMGFALHLRGRSREAIPLFEEALRIEPADARLRNNLGFALAASGDFARAARQFELAGTKAEARNNLGLAYERAGNLLQAYDQYLEAVQLDAASATARGNLEHVAREMGRVLPELGTVPEAGAKGGS
jgi:Flp pilus assembly protein TadD